MVKMRPAPLPGRKLFLFSIPVVCTTGYLPPRFQREDMKSFTGVQARIVFVPCPGGCTSGYAPPRFRREGIGVTARQSRTYLHLHSLVSIFYKQEFFKWQSRLAFGWEQA